jgi:demethylmacrocin O-methyltransferase
LTKLGSFYGTDKAAPKHRYTVLYERHLGHRRREPLRILEIGIGGYKQGTGGSSLRMWRTYFPKARVYGIDIEPRDLREPRIRTFCGDQADEEFLREVIRRVGTPDLVIDDGSHRSRDVDRSFEVLFPLLAPDGVYVIEDTFYSYETEYGGGPSGTPGTTVERIKQLVDDISIPTAHGANTNQTRPAALHVYPRIVFIEK